MPAIKECVLSNGQRVYYRSKADVDILAREMFERPIYLQHGLAVKNGDCIFDIGANIGFFLLQLGQTLQQATVYSFEPIPEVFEVLQCNAKQFSKLDCRLFNIGLARAAGEVPFQYFPRASVASTMYPDRSPEFRRNSRRFVLAEIRERSRILRWLVDGTPQWLWFPVSESIRRHYQSARTVRCRLRRLSEVIDDERIARIDLLKVDTEGAEDDVLAGIDERHWGLIRQAVVEVHGGRDSLERVEKLLCDHGFSTASESVVPGVEHLYLVFGRRKE